MEPTNNQALSESFMLQLNIVILQFLRELNMMDACHQFERDRAIYFDLPYFEELIRQGLWGEVEHYVTGFTSPTNNDLSWKIFFEIRQQKYLEALERSEPEKAKAIFRTDLSVIIGTRRDLFHQLAALQYVPEFRSHLHCRPWIDIQTSRNTLAVKLSELVVANPDLAGKFILPEVQGRLVDFAKQSLEAQFSRCRCPVDVWALLSDHRCPQQSDRNSPANNGHQQNRNQLVPTLAPSDLETVQPVPTHSNGVDHQPGSSGATHGHSPARIRTLGASTPIPQPEGTRAINVPFSSLPQEGTSGEATPLTRNRRALTEVGLAGTSSPPAPVARVTRKDVVKRPALEATNSVSGLPQHTLPSRNLVSTPLAIPNSRVAQTSGPRFSLDAAARRRRTPRVEVCEVEAAQGNTRAHSRGLAVDLNSLPLNNEEAGPSGSAADHPVVEMK